MIDDLLLDLDALSGIIATEAYDLLVRLRPKSEPTPDATKLAQMLDFGIELIESIRRDMYDKK